MTRKKHPIPCDLLQSKNNDGYSSTFYLRMPLCLCLTYTKYINVLLFEVHSEKHLKLQNLKNKYSLIVIV